MSVIAEYAVAPDYLALANSIEAVPEATLRIERTYATDPERPIAFIWVPAPDIEAFDSALAADPSVADFERIRDIDGECLYRIQAAAGRAVITYPKWVEVGGERLKAYYDDGWWHARTRYPSREALSEYREYLQDKDVTFRLKRLYDSGHRDGDGPTLTDEQRETLELAYERGYFEVPRSISTSELADELGVSNQAVSERLRRASARLVEDALR
ncbi:helix-turn-helix domain-containing protein [Natronomonas sp.]|uniref:helix-turn-helix domain-containing protein n=1 Tax=Natronomonas sp. TaxID=2184060 RepID=UPI002FC3D347